MMAFWRTWLLLLAFLASGCSQSSLHSLDTDKLPFRLESVASYDPSVVLEDLDNDGRYEILKTHNDIDPVTGARSSFLQIRTHANFVVDQINFPALIWDVRPLDWNHDGKQELAVTLMRNDSLFLSFIDIEGNKLFSFFLSNGHPRREPEGELEWDPAITDYHLVDVNRDGRNDLVTVIRTGLARAPRGLLVHSLPDGQLLAQKLVGAMILDSHCDDFDGDGIAEVLVRSFAPNNGAQAGGFDDRHSYLIAFKLSLPIEIVWSKEYGEAWSLASLNFVDFNGDGRRDFIARSSTLAAKHPLTSSFEIIEPGTWRSLQQIEFPNQFRGHFVMDIDRDGKLEIVALRHPDEIWVMDREFRVIKRRKLSVGEFLLAPLRDSDGDGLSEIVAHNDKAFYVLGPDLEIRAFMSDAKYLGGIPKEVGEPSSIRVVSNGKTLLLRMVENKFYLFFRYGKPALILVTISMALVLIASASRMRDRSRLSGALQDFVFMDDSRGLMFLQPDGRILRSNHRLFSCLQQPEPNSRKDHHFTEVFDHDELLAFLQASLQPPYHRREINITCAAERTERVVHVIADPLTIKGHSRPHWLIQFLDKSVDLEIHQARTWGKMAQRIAHDIKNPLTSILLTQQRLQMEYRERSPESAAVYDGYTAKITDRIEALRLMTRNFMKLINLEKLHLTEIELHPFLRDAVQHLSKNLPPDVELEVKLNGHNETAGLDQDQIKVLLENLLSNAVNAMPRGGKISLTANLAKGLHLAATETEPHDYAVIEISDTGKGMPRDMLDKIFEPDFTATENGTGLGLAIVKKIVEGHHGHIEVESDPGMGTVFSVYLPVR
ncbi:GHKL domain-containing protein [candidate division KSB1 bacterium]|nr:GHKL domain-containing protein [candidate division KSB1 bacterium]